MSKCSNKYKIGETHCEKCCGSDHDVCSEYCITKSKCENCNELICLECNQNFVHNSGFFCDCCYSGQCDKCSESENMFIKCHNTYDCCQYACLKCKKDQTCVWCEEVFCNNHMKTFSYKTNEKICNECIIKTYNEGYGIENVPNVNFLFKRYLLQKTNLIPDLNQIIIDYYGKVS